MIGVGAGLTVGVAGALLWSGLDTLSARDAYAAAPTQAGYNDGTSRELRTNALIGVTAVLGVATAVGAAFFTEWGGGRARRTVSVTFGLEQDIAPPVAITLGDTTSCVTTASANDVQPFAGLTTMRV